MPNKLYREQQLNCDLATAWSFFSNPLNLAGITPEDMGFVVLSEINDANIYEGMEIDYKVSPLWGIPMKWKTRITMVDFQKSFTDFQEKGPYKLWNHRHDFIPNAQGVLMKDTVDYEMPWGVLGDIAHRILIKRKLEEIFNYRFHILEQMFHV